MPRDKPWTDSDLLRAIELRRAGVTCSDIAAGLGRAPNSVASKLRYEGIIAPPEVIRARRDEQFKSLRQSEVYEARRLAALRASYNDKRRARSSEIARTHRLWETSRHCKDKKLAALEKANQARLQQQLGWCPPHMLDAYRSLVAGGNGRLTASEARKMFTAEWLQQLRRALHQIAEVAKPLAEQQARQHNSFEAQLERVKAGKARVVPAFRPGRALTEQRSLMGSGLADIAA